MFINKNISIICGTSFKENNPFNIFDDLVLNFLDKISKEILHKRNLATYSDLLTFAFWCRKSNLIKIKDTFSSNRFGRGVALHICPSNVAMNYAYSLAFGLLSGNRNIVRLPSIHFPQVLYLNKIIKKLLKNKELKLLNNRICLISYERSEKISNELSEISDCRLIWGGDDTINLFKKFKTKPRVIDLYFSNRYSLCLINSKKFNSLSIKAIEDLAYKFFNDAYTMNQNACSSPKSIIWSGNPINKKKELFWSCLNNIVNNKFEFDISISNKKILNLNKVSINTKFYGNVHYKNFNLVRIKDKNNKIPKNLEDLQPNLGTFFEFQIKDNKIFKKFISSKTQTLTYFGYEKKEIIEIINKNNLSGIDRIIKIGNAFEMSHIWDGSNIIGTLSREIQVI